jgi:hypothetical protein
MYRSLSDAQIDDITSPYTLADRVPDFREKMDAAKEIREAHECEVSRFTKKEYDGWRHVGSVPSEVMTALYHMYTPEELVADGGKVMLEWLHRNRAHYGVGKI